MPKEKINGERIKAVRETLGMTQRELSVILQCDSTIVSRWEHGGAHMADTGYVERFLKLEKQAERPGND